jgi:diguanylate cyclase (GGDEF)-like protein
MLLPQTKEREYRFKLALRMGLPIFALIIALVSHTLIENYTTLKPSFYIESALLLLVSVYFIFYLIYSGFNVKITDDVSKTFTRQYLFNYLKKELKNNKEYTLILISIDNLNDINKLYGIKNGDKVLQNVAEWIASYLKSQNIVNFPMGHIKGGDFLIGLKGLKSEYNTTLELMCLKSSEFKVGDIEVKISGGLTDTLYSNELNYMIEQIFETQEKNRSFKNRETEDSISPNELESLIIKAIETRSIAVMTQDIFEGEKLAFKECYIKLKTQDGKILFPKRYLKVINKLGLGVEYDLMILEELVSKYIKDENVIHAINVSPTSLRNERYFSRAKELLKESDKKIMFILSEQEYYSHTNRYKTILNSLKKSGILIAIDRLGAIHTSFLYLRELDIDIVRFDTYYSHEDKISQNRSIIEGFVTMAKEKGIKSWIKNIESNDVLSVAKEMNIDYIQGKFLSDLK